MCNVLRKIILTLSFGALLLTVTSCHEDESYYCYLVEGDWPQDTINSYDEAFWFYKKKQKPEDECKVGRADLIIANQYDPNYTCDCLCGWESD